MKDAEADLTRQIADTSNQGEKTELEERRTQIQKARTDLNDHFKEGEGGMMAELIDTMTQMVGGTKPLPVKITGWGG
jgi:uncharacterized membrane-anchored protein YhcB (DUF1043 family)